MKTADEIIAELADRDIIARADTWWAVRALIMIAQRDALEEAIDCAGVHAKDCGCAKLIVRALEETIDRYGLRE